MIDFLLKNHVTSQFISNKNNYKDSKMFFTFLIQIQTKSSGRVFFNVIITIWLMTLYGTAVFLNPLFDDDQQSFDDGRMCEQ